MRVRVRLFARYREAAGQERLELDLPEGGTVEAAWSAVVARHPALAPYRPFTLFAVGHDYVSPEHPLKPGDELCLFPPVSGGRDRAAPSSGTEAGGEPPAAARDPGDTYAVVERPLSPNDAAAAVVVMSARKAQELGIRPRLVWRSFGVSGVEPEIMGIGPVVAIPKALALAGLKRDDIGLIELNEAFAVQALAVIRLAGLDPERVNVNGGAIALGHPLGCTGAKLTATLLREMERRGVRYGMVTMCVGGGQGAAGIFERLG